jgi:hypothetical protein
VTTTDAPAPPRAVPVRFNLSAAQSAVARDEEGVDLLPGDQELIDAYEAYCQQEYERFQQQVWDAERAAWLSRQCPDCEDGGTGEVCDEHSPERCTCDSGPDGQYDTDGCVQHDLIVCGLLLGEDI